MGVKGFKLSDGTIQKYEYSALENIVTDSTLSVDGVAADAGAVGDELLSLQNKSFDLDELDRLKLTGLSGTAGETTDRITQLTNSIGAEASARMAADNALSSSISAETSARAAADAGLASDIAVERARITNLASLNSGSTTGDAELADIRVGGNGITYASAGEAVRVQYEELKQDLSSLNESELYFETIIPNEYVDKTNGADLSYNGWSRTDFIDITDVVGMVIYNSHSGGDYNAFYDSNKEFISKITVLTTPTYIAIPSNACYMKFSQGSSAMDKFHIKLLRNQSLLIGGNHATILPYDNSKIKINRSGTTITVVFPAYMGILFSNQQYAKRFSSDTTVTHTIENGANNFALLFDAKANTFRIIQPLDINATNKIAETEFVLFSFYIDNWYRMSVDIPNHLVDFVDHYNIDIPNYYWTHLTTKINTVNDIGQDIMNGDSFVFITDCHYPNPSNTNVINTKHSPELIKELKKRTGVRFVVNGGDNFDSQDTVDNMINAQIEFADQFNYLKTGEYFSVIGNHEWYTDLNSDPRVIPTYSALRYAIINKFANSLLWLDEYGDYYYDNIAQKIRYFVVSCDFDTGMTTEQIHTILEEFKNIPDEYHLMVIDHAMSNDAITAPRHWQICRGLELLKNKSSDTIEGVTYNYSNKNVDVLPVLCGHTHMDGNYTSGSGILIIATTTDAYAREETSTSGLTRTAGTYTEQAFDVVQVDLDEHKIYLTRVGAGSNRIFTY